MQKVNTLMLYARSRRIANLSGMPWIVSQPVRLILRRPSPAGSSSSGATSLGEMRLMARVKAAQASKERAVTRYRHVTSRGRRLASG